MNAKRVLWNAVFLFTLTVLAGAQSITLVKPNSGGNFAKGSSMAVVWQYSGVSDDATVRVLLFQDGGNKQTITSSVSIHDKSLPLGSGGIPGMWKVGALEGGGSAAPGCKYTIRVVVNGTQTSDFCDQAFCITDPALSVFRLDSPKGGEKWEINSTQKIAWTSNPYSGQLLIKLYKGGLEWGTISGGTSASAGFLNWKVGGKPSGHEYVPAGDYAISIEPVTKTAGGPSMVKSGAFSITSGQFIVPGGQPRGGGGDERIAGAMADKWIKMLSPVAGMELKRLENFHFQWQCSDFMWKQHAKLTLLRSNGQFVREMLPNFPLSLGHYTVQLWTQDPLGDCFLRIESIEWPAVKADSAVFHVVPSIAKATFSFPAETKNYYRYVSHKTFTFSGGREFKTTDPNKPDGWYDPGPGNIRVGFKNECSGGNGVSYAYRCWIFFDLKGREDVEILSASMSFTEQPGVPTPMHLHRRTTPWDGTYQSLFSNAGLVEVNPADLKAVVQEWVKNPTQNYGLVMMGNNENYACNEAGAIHMLYDVKLTLEEQSIE